MKKEDINLHIEKDYLDFIKLLNKHRVNYCVVGAYAVAVHSRPRYTRDIDFLVEPTAENSTRVYNAIKEFGASVSQIAQDYFIKSGNVFQMGVEPVQIHVMNEIDGAEMERVLKKRVKFNVDGEPVYFIGKEELIRNKKVASRKKDEADLEILQESEKYRKKKPQNDLEL